MIVHGTPQPQVICRDAGAGGYQAFPDLLRLNSGDLLCVFYAGYTHISHPSPALPRGARVCAIRSTDEGVSWSESIIVADTPWDDRDPSIVQLPDGRILCNWFTYYGGAASRDGVPWLKEIWLCESLDGGLTWSEPWLAESLLGDTWGCTARPLILPDGALLMPVYREHGIEDIRCAVILSEDAGRTWSEPTWVDPVHGDCDEPDLCRLPDGRILCMMRANHAQTMWWSQSSDEGRSWSRACPVGFPGHAPNLLLTQGGALLCTHRLPGTALHVSFDLAVTWHGPVALDEHIGAYTSKIEMPDGRILCAYYEEGEGSAIRLVAFRVDGESLRFE